MSSTPTSNVITLTDKSQTIIEIKFADHSIHDGSKNYVDPPTVHKAGNVFTITFLSDRSGSSDVADSFNATCGGAAHEYAAVDGGGTPNKLNFYFAVTVSVRTPTGVGSAMLYLGQGNKGSTNNWWLGGACINSSRPSLNIPLDNGVHLISLPLQGSVSDYTFFAGTMANKYPIQHIFVLMLENHSFDNMLAMSNIPGITAATTANENSYGGESYHARTGAPASMPVDPGHEFDDVVEQLAGEGARYTSGAPYPAISNAGYVTNYATHVAASKVQNADLSDVMACFETQRQLPVLHQLASTFTLCDHWFSSMPGPTWPNRFFVHGASSAGLDHSPSKADMKKWFVRGFEYPHGSIFDALRNSNISYRLYSDTGNSFAEDPSSKLEGGWIPQVASIENVSLASVNPLDNFAADLAKDYTAQYTFIEPNYGDILWETYAGGSSQHPLDDVCGGESLIKYVYESIRNSPVWNQSLLIITYDEHGGFYDSVVPGSVTAPNDDSSPQFNDHGFTFTTLGARVPAIIVSPYVAAAVSDKVYDHGTVLKTIETLLGVNPLTDRDGQAYSLDALLLQSPRTDCPTQLNNPAPSQANAAKLERVRAAEGAMSDPLPECGNLVGALGVLLKTEYELSDRTDASLAQILARFESLKTRGQAQAYIEQMHAKVVAARVSKHV